MIQGAERMKENDRIRKRTQRESVRLFTHDLLFVDVDDQRQFVVFSSFSSPVPSPLTALPEGRERLRIDEPVRGRNVDI